MRREMYGVLSGAAADFQYRVTFGKRHCKCPQDRVFVTLASFGYGVGHTASLPRWVPSPHLFKTLDRASIPPPSSPDACFGPLGDEAHPSTRGARSGGYSFPGGFLP